MHKIKLKTVLILVSMSPELYTSRRSPCILCIILCRKHNSIVQTFFVINNSFYFYFMVNVSNEISKHQPRFCTSSITYLSSLYLYKCWRSIHQTRRTRFNFTFYFPSLKWNIIFIFHILFSHGCIGLRQTKDDHHFSCL